MSLRVSSSCLYSRRRGDHRREWWAAADRSTSRHHHDDGCHGSSRSDVCLHVQQPDLQRRPLLHGGQWHLQSIIPWKNHAASYFFCLFIFANLLEQILFPIVSVQNADTGTWIQTFCWELWGLDTNVGKDIWTTKITTKFGMTHLCQWVLINLEPIMGKKFPLTTCQSRSSYGLVWHLQLIFMFPRWYISSIEFLTFSV